MAVLPFVNWHFEFRRRAAEHRRYKTVGKPIGVAQLVLQPLARPSPSQPPTSYGYGLYKLIGGLFYTGAFFHITIFSKCFQFAACRGLKLVTNISVRKPNRHGDFVVTVVTTSARSSESPQSTEHVRCGTTNAQPLFGSSDLNRHA